MAIKYVKLSHIVSHIWSMRMAKKYKKNIHIKSIRIAIKYIKLSNVVGYD